MSIPGLHPEHISEHGIHWYLTQQRHQVRLSQLSPTLLGILILTALTIQHCPQLVLSNLSLIILLPFVSHPELLDKHSPLLDRQEDGGQDGDQLVEERVVKGCLLQVSGWHRWLYVGCSPASHACWTPHDVVHDEQVIIQGGLVQHNGHHLTQPGLQIIQHHLITDILPQKLEQYADGQSDLLYT